MRALMMIGWYVSSAKQLHRDIHHHLTVCNRWWVCNPLETGVHSTVRRRRTTLPHSNQGVRPSTRQSSTEQRSTMHLDFGKATTSLGWKYYCDQMHVLGRQRCVRSVDTSLPLPPSMPDRSSYSRGHRTYRLCFRSPNPNKHEYSYNRYVHA